MLSYDIFDTIIGRVCFNGHDIFSILEKKTCLNEFKRKRIEFEIITRNFDKTYDMLSSYYNKSMEDVRKLELQLEYEMSFPITKYLLQVKPEDILISDMYLNDNQISYLLNKHKVMKNKIYVSYDGKATKRIWTTEHITKNIQCHYGDNQISDVNNPREFNINVKYVSDTKLNYVENFLRNINPQFAYIIRAVRLSCDLNSDLWKIFTEFALPFSILVCFKVRKYYVEQKCDSIVFLSRDGYWFKAIYDILFKNDQTRYLYFSRNLVNNNKSYIINELNNIRGKKLVFDLQGTGNTFLSLNVPNVQYFMCFLTNTTTTNTSSNKIKHLYNSSNANAYVKRYIEDLFSAPHGSAYKYDERTHEIVLLDPEYDVQQFKPYFLGVELFQKYFSIMKQYYDLNIDPEKLEFAINNINDHVDKSLIGSISSYVNHVNTHNYDNLKIPVSFYSQINQDKYYIENVVKYKPNGTFLDIGAYDGVIGSNTLTLEKCLNWRGILVECNPVLYEQCKKARCNIVCKKALYEEDDVKLTFTIPKGQDIKGGKEQLGGIKKLLKPESVNAFAKSYKECEEITVQSININKLLKQYNIYHIDYVSLDIEGGELSVLSSWDFTTHKVDFITVEHGNVLSYQQKIYNLLKKKGFKLYRNNKWDDEYVVIS